MNPRTQKKRLFGDIATTSNKNRNVPILDKRPVSVNRGCRFQVGSIHFGPRMWRYWRWGLENRWSIELQLCRAVVEAEQMIFSPKRQGRHPQSRRSWQSTAGRHFGGRCWLGVYSNFACLSNSCFSQCRKFLALAIKFSN